MGKGSFKFPTNMESGCIWTNDEVITKATPIITGSGSQLDFYLGVSDIIDGTYTWEGPVTSGVTWTFATTGKKFIKWRAIGLSYIITKIEIKINQ